MKILSIFQLLKKNQTEETIVSTDKSLLDGDNKVPSNIAGLEDFSLTSIKSDGEESIDPNSLFSLPEKENE